MGAAAGLGITAFALPLARPALLRFAVAVGSLSLHGAAHARAAAALGDPGPRRLGRASLLPTAHFNRSQIQLVVVLCSLGVGLPLPAQEVDIDRSTIQQGPYGRAKYVFACAAGPLMNLALAGLGAVSLALTVGSGLLGAAQVAQAVLAFNVASFCFTSLPLAGLDGQRVLAALLPEPWAGRFERASTSQWAERTFNALWYLGLLGSYNPAAWPAAHLSDALRQAVAGSRG